jgi:hypothetical protein
MPRQAPYLVVVEDRRSTASTDGDANQPMYVQNGKGGVGSHNGSFSLGGHFMRGLLVASLCWTALFSAVLALSGIAVPIFGGGKNGSREGEGLILGAGPRRVEPARPGADDVERPVGVKYDSVSIGS